MDSANPQIEKIILLGDTSTGKSSFLKNYMSNYRTKASCLTALNANPRKYLQLWDTPGREKFRLMPMAMIGNYQYCLVFYDIGSRHTFDVAKTIIENVLQRTNLIKVALIGNKLDLIMSNPLKREVEEAEAAKYSHTRGVFFSEYSFQDRADKLLQQFLESSANSPSTTTKLELPAEQACTCV